MTVGAEPEPGHAASGEELLDDLPVNVGEAVVAVLDGSAARMHALVTIGT